MAKTTVVHCKPKACHGDIIVDYLEGDKMPNGRKKHYWLHEANRILTMALIPSRKRRKQIEEAMECLGKHETELNAKDNSKKHK